MSRAGTQHPGGPNRHMIQSSHANCDADAEDEGFVFSMWWIVQGREGGGSGNQRKYLNDVDGFFDFYCFLREMSCFLAGVLAAIVGQLFSP